MVHTAIYHESAGISSKLLQRPAEGFASDQLRLADEVFVRTRNRKLSLLRNSNALPAGKIFDLSEFAYEDK